MPGVLRQPGLCAALLVFLACGGEAERSAPDPGREAVAAGPEFVGTDACAECHPAETERWRGSHHDLAMQEATPDAVLGDFDDASYTHFGVTSTFSRRGDRFVVRTDGPDGELEDYEIAYAFGVEPLQQYLVRFPDGRLQALGLAWDSRPAESGGQRWFHLYPDEPIPHDDLLHWTGLQQNWNHMCAACHSTNLHKGYRPERDRFETTWSEIDVACEACHGPASSHVDWARALPEGQSPDPEADRRLTIDFGDRTAWIFEPGAPIAHRTRRLLSDVEIETCGRCHSRRSRLSEEPARGRPLADTHRVELLRDGLYHADGQILDEVYVYGSFLQSRMHAAGVTCSDCHDPHSLAIEAPPDQVCAKCHRPDVFGSPDHHHHAPASEGASCVACHMPARTYMVVDPRRDHSFRVPRPDLTVEIGTPNACDDCHRDRGAAWSAEAVRHWVGPDREPPLHFAEALRAGRDQAAEAERALAAVIGDERQPAIVRATALDLLAPLLSRASVRAVSEGLRDPDPLVRSAALSATEAFEPRARLELAAPLLRDSTLAVRLEAERVLRPIPPPLWDAADRPALARVQDEFRAVQRLHADRPESWLNLGVFAAQRGETDESRRSYERALSIEPRFAAAWVNLADLYRQTGRDAEAEQVLRRGLEQLPDGADLHHALGLALVRLGRPDEALPELARASELEPERSRFAYVYAVALHSAGATDEALERLDAAHRRFPADRTVLAALIAIHDERGEHEEAARYALALESLQEPSGERP